MDESTFVRLLDERLQNYPTKQDLQLALDNLEARWDAKLDAKLDQKLNKKLAPLEAKIDAIHLHFDVAMEAWRDEFRVLAEGFAHISEKHDQSVAESRARVASVDRRLDRLDVRVTRLEEHSGLDTP